KYSAYGKFYMTAAAVLRSNKSLKTIQGSWGFGKEIIPFVATRTDDDEIVINPGESKYKMNDPKILSMMYNFKKKFQDSVQEEQETGVRG
ncbi:hypothetical protein H4219_001756, partial [Mycoemilia scoparia]